MAFPDSKRVLCLPAPLSAGAPCPGAELGATTLLDAGLGGILAGQGVSMLLAGDVLPPLTDKNAPLAEWLARHMASCANALSQRMLPLILGGDHSVAAATWRGLGRSLGEPPALIWMDAHLDAHTPATSPSGNLHGMPLAALLGFGESVLSAIPGPTLDARRVAVIGAHSYEAEVAALVVRLGVKVYQRSDVRQRGLRAIIDELLEGWRGLPWGVSVDMDVVDPQFAPGVSTPAPGGLSPDELLSGMAGLCREPGCVGFELVEFNPQRDIGGQTLARAMSLCSRVFAVRP